MPSAMWCEWRSDVGWIGVEVGAAAEVGDDLGQTLAVTSDMA